MQYYKTLDIPSLLSIQQEITKLLPDNIKTVDGVKYIYDNPDVSTEFFLNSKSLMTYLTNLKLIDHIAGISAITKHKQSNSDIHIDTGTHKLSLNIPLLGCENTYTAFYKTDAAPSVFDNKVNKYYKFSSKYCREMSRLDTAMPAVIDTTVPHCIFNPTNSTRIMMLIRLNQYINFDWFE